MLRTPPNNQDIDSDDGGTPLAAVINSRAAASPRLTRPKSSAALAPASAREAVVSPRPRDHDSPSMPSPGEISASWQSRNGKTEAGGGGGSHYSSTCGERISEPVLKPDGQPPRRGRVSLEEFDIHHAREDERLSLSVISRRNPSEAGEASEVNGVVSHQGASRDHCDGMAVEEDRGAAGVAGDGVAFKTPSDR
ncbi:unnamed protein product, partial [Sphacelaria rigidula]